MAHRRRPDCRTLCNLKDPFGGTTMFTQKRSHSYIGQCGTIGLRTGLTSVLAVLVSVLALMLFQGCSKDNPIKSDDPQPEPVAYWSFNDEANPGLDNSGNGHDGTIQGATSETGICGKGLRFDGGLDAMTCGSAVLNTAPYTICVWVKADAIIPGVARWIVSNGAESGKTYGLSLALQNNSTWQFAVKNSSGTEGGVAADTATSAGWVFLCGTWDGTSASGSIKLYINGLEVASSNPGSAAKGSQSDLRIGAPSNPDHMNDYHWAGVIDEIRIYDIALNNTEIQNLYQQCKK